MFGKPSKQIQGENIKNLFEAFLQMRSSEYPLTYAFIEDETVCNVCIFGDEDEMLQMVLSILMEIFDDCGDDMTIEEFADGIKDSLLEFFFQQGSEE